MHSRYVCGLLAPSCIHHARKTWNAALRAAGVPATFEFYRSSSRNDIELRLSEMFLHGRRGYVLAEPLQSMAVSLVDSVSPEAMHRGGIDVIRNDGGVLSGDFLGYFATHDVEPVLRFWRLLP